MAYYIMKFLSWLACCFSMDSCNSFGRWLGRVTWVAVPAKRKKLAKDNIMRCLKVDEQEAVRIAKASWVQFGPMVMEILRYPELIKGYTMAKYVTIDGLKYLQEAVKAGKGGVIATSHSDSWELMGAALAQAGIPLVGVAHKQQAGDMDRFIMEYRQMVGMHISYKEDVRDMLRLIKKGWMIGLIHDQDCGEADGIILDFLGRKTNCFMGPASMARSNNCPIFPGEIIHRPDGGHHITIFPPIYVEKTKNKHEDIRKVSQMLADILDEHIRKYPEDWFWLHDRWKSARNLGLD